MLCLPRELASIHGVSLMTARHALADLEREGLVERSRGGGNLRRAAAAGFSSIEATPGNVPNAPWKDARPPTVIDTNGVKSIHEFHKPPQVFFAALKKVDAEKKIVGGRYSPDVPADITNKYAQDIAAEVAAIKSITDRLHATMFQTIQAQLNAFKTIAGALRATPGRKQVVWITDSFEWMPNELESRLETKDLDREKPDSGVAVRLSRDELKPVTLEYQRTIERLNQAHISIYPASPGGDSWVNEALQHFAVATGGTRIGYVHDPGKVVQEATRNCSTYYLVEYSPTDAVKNVRWNKLKITSEKAEHVMAPEGRFAAPPKEWQD